MQDHKLSTGVRISAEASAPADLDDVCRWLVDSRSNPVRINGGDLPALGHESRLALDLPITAPRAVLCALYLLEDVDAGGCLLAGQLRFVARPSGPGIKLSFNGRTAMAMSAEVVRHQAHHITRQLVELIAETIRRPPSLAPLLASHEGALKPA
jgi:hypothetical protein